ncbi:hypothetical protein Tco_1498758 [Tanacetum coccineum]
MELLNDYDCEIRYHPGKANVVADALSRNERIKPLRNVKEENLCGMNKEFEIRADGTLYIEKRSWLSHEKIIQIKNQIQAAHDRQKSYAYVRRKTLEFQVGDIVMRMVSLWKGVIRFGKWGKLNPQYIRPFKILNKVGTVAYRLELLEQLSPIHSNFHVSNLKKCLSEEAIPLDEIQINDKLHFLEEPVEIIDREVKRLKQNRISIVKVRWNLRRGPDVYLGTRRPVSKEVSTSLR